MDQKKTRGFAKNVMKTCFSTQLLILVINAMILILYVQNVETFKEKLFV